jgi:hypothetical protein
MFRHEPEAVLKDNDLRTRPRFRFSPAEAKSIKRQLYHDTNFLRDLGVMDYSLLGTTALQDFSLQTLISSPSSSFHSCCVQEDHATDSGGTVELLSHPSLSLLTLVLEPFCDHTFISSDCPWDFRHFPKSASCGDPCGVCLLPRYHRLPAGIQLHEEGHCLHPSLLATLL